MIKWYLLLLAITICIPIQSAFAEITIGNNFDNEQLNATTFHWQSHYNRIYDGNQWQNYIATNDANEITFKSVGISFRFDKTNCDFALYEPNSTQQTIPVINSFKHDFAIDGIPIITSTCNVTSMIQSEDSVHFIVNKDALEIKYDLIPTLIDSLELTYSLPNNEGKNSTLTVIETCKDCSPISIDGNRIDFGTYTFDTKNEIHNTIKDTKQVDGDYIIQYEKEITDKDVLVIDPTFSSNNPTEDGNLHDTGNNSVCDANALTRDVASGNLWVLKDTIASADDCNRSYSQWDITSIPTGSDVTDTDFSFDIQGITGALNCDFMPIMTASPTSASDANLWTDIGDGTAYLNADATCTTTGNNKLVDLGTQADADVETRLATDWFAVGIKLDNEVLDASPHYSLFAGEEDGTATPKPTLDIVYQLTASAPTNLKAITFSTSRIDLSWTTPSSCPTTCTGYKIWRESPVGNGFSTLVANTSSQTTTYSNTGLTAGIQYNYKVSAWTHAGLGENSTTSANYTITNAPTNLNANTISNSRIDLSWTAPSGTVNGYKIERESPVGNGFSNLVANTTTTTTTYSNTGLTQNTQYNYRVSAHNLGGTSSASTNAFNTTFGQLVGTFYINYTQVGDALGITPRLNLTGGNPNPTLVNIILKNGSSTLQTKSLGYELIANSSIVYLPNFYEGSLGNTPSAYKVTFNIQNATSTYAFDSNTTGSIDQLFRPTYLPAITSGLDDYNYTYIRLGEDLSLNVTRNQDSQILNCNYITSETIDDGGAWLNTTGTSYYYKTYTTDGSGTNIYTRCYNPNELVFTLISYGNTTGILVGLAGMESTLGTFFGLPLVFMFILFIASLYSGNRAGMGLLVTMIVVGILSAIGAFTLAENIWGMVLVIASVGLFALRKIL